MKISFINMGKINEKYIGDGISEYINRIDRYIPFDIIDIKSPKEKGLSKDNLKEAEAQLFIKQLRNFDYIIALDEHGKYMSSVEFANYIQNIMNKGIKKIAFITGGAYGFAETLMKKTNDSVSLSKMTFPHQLVRLIFVEQLFRAMTILKNEPYHHI